MSFPPEAISFLGSIGKVEEEIKKFLFCRKIEECRIRMKWN
jgi:hypothetical protein